METTTTTPTPIPSPNQPPATAPARAVPDGPALRRPPIELVRRVVGSRSFATVATTSSAGHSHVAGMLYAAVGDDLWVSTLRSSRKARNVAATGRAAVCIPIRRLPVGPPSSVQFQGRAEIVAVDDPEILGLVEAGRLKAVTSHGELELPGGCFVRITPVGRLHTYGLGMSIWSLVRDPLAAGGVVDLDPPAGRAA